MFNSCSSSNNSDETTVLTIESSTYVKEPETGLPLNVSSSQTLLFNLEQSGNSTDIDSGGDGYDEYTLVISEDESKYFCIGEDSSSTMSIEILQEGVLLESISNSCKLVSLQKGNYLIKLINTDAKDYLVHVENRGGADYTGMSSESNSPASLSPSKAIKRSSTAVDDSQAFDTIIFQTNTCTGCNLYGIDLSHYSYGDYSNFPDSMSYSYLNSLDSPYDIGMRYTDNTSVPSGMVYEYSDFGDANMSYSVFNDVTFLASDLEGVDFSYSSFINCTFSDSNLKDVNFEGAIFLDTNFITGDVSGAEFSSKPSLSALYKEILTIVDIDDTHFGNYIDLEYSATSLAVLMSDGNIWVQPDLDNSTTVNIGSPDGKRIASSPKLIWWDYTKTDYTPYYETNPQSTNLAYVVTDDGGLYYKEYTLQEKDSAWTSYSTSDSWIQINDTSTSCASAPVATVSFDNLDSPGDGDKVYLNTQVSCTNEDGNVYQWNRKVKYTYGLENIPSGKLTLVASTSDSGYGLPSTIDSPSSTAILSGENEAGVEVFADFNTDNTLKTLTLKDDTQSKSYTSNEMFSDTATSFAAISYYTLMGVPNNLVISLNESELLATSVNSDFSYTYNFTDIIQVDSSITFVSSVDASSIDSGEIYISAIGNDGNIHLYEFISKTWKTSLFLPTATYSSSAATSSTYEDTNFSNTYFGLSTMNVLGDEAADFVLYDTVIPDVFDGVSNVYLYNFYFSEEFTFNNISNVTFDTVKLYETIFSGTNDKVTMSNASLRCNTLDDSILTNWSMNNSTWSIQDGYCFNTAKNTSVDASIIAPNLTGAEIKLFDLSDASNITGLGNVDYSSTDMSSMQMTYATVSGSEDNYVQLDSSVWSNANLSNVTFEYSDFEDASLVLDTAKNITFSNSYLVGVNLSGDFTNAIFSSSQIDGISVNAGTSLNLATFSDVTTNGLIANNTTCTFESVNLSGASFSNVFFQDCSFNGATLSAAKTFNNATFVQNDFSNAEFSGSAFGLSDSFFYGSCFDNVSTDDVTTLNTTFSSSGTTSTDLVYDIRSDAVYSGIDITYKLSDSCSNYQAN